MSCIRAHKTLLGFLVLLVFVFSANALLFVSHAAEEARGTVTAAGAVEHPHDNSGHEHGADQDAGHCCDTDHSHDMTDGNPFVLESWPLYSAWGGGDPTRHLPEVFPERFIPPRHA